MGGVLQKILSDIPNWQGEQVAQNYHDSISLALCLCTSLIQGLGLFRRSATRISKIKLCL